MSTSIDLSQALALADLISASVHQLVDVASSKHSEHVLDSNDSFSDADADADADRTPVLQIVAATAQLSALVRPPVQAIMEAATGFHLSAALRLVVEASVVEIIRARGTSSYPHTTPALHVTEISRLSGIDSRKLARILRLLATHHIFTETAPDTFANNRLSAALDSGAPLSDILVLPDGDSEKVAESSESEEARRDARWRKKYGAPSPGAGLAALIGVTTDESMLHATTLAETLLSSPVSPPSLSGNGASKEDGLSYLSSLDPDDPLAAPFARARPDAARERQTMFNWLSAPGRTHRLMRFGCAMKGMGAMMPESAILKGFDWSALPAGSEVIDIGGGVGAAALPIVRANPSLRLIVQDTEGVVAVAPKFWESNFPEALEQGRVAFEVQDFFAPRPNRVGRPPAAFLLRMIMHNWPDAQAEEILRRIRDAAVAQSSGGSEGEVQTKLVIVDSILMPACREASKANGTTGSDSDSAGAKIGGVDVDAGQAPEPLLANWGVANGLAYKLDLQMLCNHNAGERTLAEFVGLLGRAGWRAVAVHAAHESWMPQIVAVPAPDAPRAEPELESEPGQDQDGRGAVTSPTLVGSPTPQSQSQSQSPGETARGGDVEAEKEKEKEKEALVDGRATATEKKTKRRSFWRAFGISRRATSAGASE